MGGGPREPDGHRGGPAIIRGQGQNCRTLWAGGDERGISQEGVERGFVTALQLYDLAARYSGMVAELRAEAMRIAADTCR